FGPGVVLPLRHVKLRRRWLISGTAISSIVYTTGSVVALLELQSVVKRFPIGRSLRARLRGDREAAVRAVDGVTFEVDRGETLGLVGESGCGKTTLGYLIAGLSNPNAGRILFDGQDISVLGRGAERARRRNIQIIFQD